MMIWVAFFLSIFNLTAIGIGIFYSAHYRSDDGSVARGALAIVTTGFITYALWTALP